MEIHEGLCGELPTLKIIMTLMLTRVSTQKDLSSTNCLIGPNQGPNADMTVKVATLSETFKKWCTLCILWE